MRLAELSINWQGICALYYAGKLAAAPSLAKGASEHNGRQSAKSPTPSPLH